MGKRFTTDFTDGTDGCQSGNLSSVPSVLSVVPPLLHPGISQRFRIGFHKNGQGKPICVFDPFVCLRVHSWFKWIHDTAAASRG